MKFILEPSINANTWIKWYIGLKMLMNLDFQIHYGFWVAKCLLEFQRLQFFTIGWKLNFEASILSFLKSFSSNSCHWSFWHNDCLMIGLTLSAIHWFSIWTSFELVLSLWSSNQNKLKRLIMCIEPLWANSQWRKRWLLDSSLV